MVVFSWFFLGGMGERRDGSEDGNGERGASRVFVLCGFIL